MKLLVFSPYYPPHTGGLETHSDEFNKYLSQRGVDITVFTPRLPLSAPEEEIRHNHVRIIRFPAFEPVYNYPLPKFWLPSFWKLLASATTPKPDIIISRTRFFFSSFVALLYAKISRTKLIHIEHGSDFVRLSSSVKTAGARLHDYTLGFLIFRFSDINISISEAVRKFVQKFDERPSPVIYRGLDFNQIDSVKPNDQFKEQFHDKIIIGTVARLYRWKGIEYSILAVRSLPPEIRSKIAFIIVGGGEDFDRLKKLCDDSVYMLGDLPREKALGIMKCFDIYIHSSLPGGGLSTSLLEAMYCGCTVIATPNEGADEVIKNNKSGILLSGYSSQEISSSLLKLLDDNSSSLSRIGKTAEQAVKKQFSWKTSIEKYLKILSKTIK